MPTAGELLSKMLTKEKNGEDTTESKAWRGPKDSVGYSWT